MFADIQIFIKVGTVAGVDQFIVFPFEIHLVILCAGDAGRNEFRIRKQNADGVPAEVFGAAELYLAADESAESLDMGHKLIILSHAKALLNHETHKYEKNSGNEVRTTIESCLRISFDFFAIFVYFVVIRYSSHLAPSFTVVADSLAKSNAETSGEAIVTKLHFPIFGKHASAAALEVVQVSVDQGAQSILSSQNLDAICEAQLRSVPDQGNQRVQEESPVLNETISKEEM
jgi:hypothetical protein